MSEKHVGWKTRYAICVATGVVLLFIVEIALHLWVHSPHDKQEVTARKGALGRLNLALLHALDDARPWGMLASFDDRLRSSQYSLAAWSLLEPFNATAKLNRENRSVANDEIRRRLDALEKVLRPGGPGYMWPNLKPDQVFERVVEYDNLGRKNFHVRTLTQILGWPDAIIYMFREAFAGSLLSKLLNGIAILIVSPIVVFGFVGAIRESHLLGFVIFLVLTPVLYSCVTAIAWGAMYLFTSLLGGLSLFPSGHALAVILPSLMTVGWHIPIMIAHKYVEEKTEHMIASK